MRASHRRLTALHRLVVGLEIVETIRILAAKERARDAGSFPQSLSDGPIADAWGEMERWELRLGRPAVEVMGGVAVWGHEVTAREATRVWTGLVPPPKDGAA